MTPEMTTALVRGLVGGVITAGVSFFAVLGGMAADGITGNEMLAAGIATGGAFFGYLAVRVLGEGTIDSNRAKQV